MKNRRYCSSHWLVRSDCPSVRGWYAVEIFCRIPRILHSSRMNFDANRGSLSLMNLSGSPNLTKTYLTYNAAMSSAVDASRHGISTAAFVQSWSVTVRMESYPCDIGNFIMRSMVTVANGRASGFGNIGCRGAFVGCVLLFIL